MNTLTRLLILICMLAGTAACSEQNRTASPDLSDEELFELFYEINDSVGAFSAVSPEALAQDPYTLLWASASTSTRPAPSILSLSDAQALFFDGFTSLDFVDAVVIFIDGLTEAGERHFGLFARVMYSDGTPNYYAGLSDADAGVFSDEDFQVPIAGANANEYLILKTTDLHDDHSDELAPSVKFEIWVDNGVDEVYYGGQISSMAGYGSR